MTATVIIPTTGADTLAQAVSSVLSQTYPTLCYVVVDGAINYDRANTVLAQFGSDIQVARLPENVGANGFYGHRVYAAFTHLVNTEYVCYLDQDNWFDSKHVESCVQTLKDKNLQWTYSLRNIYRDNEFVCRDDCESLGKYPSYHGINHVDTNSYFLKTALVYQLASVWHGGWGQDRVFYSVIKDMLSNYDCTGEYTLNYRVDGNAGSVTADFFRNGNEIQHKKYAGNYPWQKRT
jgi:glycosyltransferase involved in cell wall biosynthesis